MGSDAESHVAASRRIYADSYKDIPAISMESSRMKVQFAPEYGGKMLSLVDKRTSREFLQQAPSPSYKILKYDGSFVEAECSGFDDMFPTIDRIPYPSYPWKGAEMPDHGEVCGLRWDCEASDDSVRLSVHGVRFPYRLEKEISFNAENAITIQYKATNLSQFDMDFMWVGHIMIDAGHHGEIVTPFKGQEARVALSGDAALGRFGDKITWPVATDQNGKDISINQVGAPESRIEFIKYYFTDKLPEGWCEYRFEDDSARLTLSFPAQSVPYLGILISRDYDLIIEPCTATMDRPDLAKLFGQSSILPANGEYTWHLKMQID